MTIELWRGRARLTTLATGGAKQRFAQLGDLRGTGRRQRFTTVAPGVGL